MGRRFELYSGMTLLTPDQIAELLTIIEQLHFHFIGQSLGSDMLTPAELDVLTAAGFDVATLPASAQGPLADVFRFGMLSATLSQAELLELTFPELRQQVARASGLAMTPQQQASFDYARRTAAIGIKGLGNRLRGSFEHVLIEVDMQQRAELEKLINDETARAVLLRHAAPDLGRRLLKLTGDSSRDFQRIADFTSHLAFDHGRAADIERLHGARAWVFKRPGKGACPSCLKLLLEQPVVGGKPKLFRLDELLANGTNIGRPAAEHKPVVGPQHPWCRCPLHHADPDHYEYSADTGGWTVPIKGSVSARVRSGIKVTAG